MNQIDTVKAALNPQHIALLSWTVGNCSTRSNVLRISRKAVDNLLERFDIMDALGSRDLKTVVLR